MSTGLPYVANRILNVVCEYYGVDPNLVASKRRHKNLCMSRHVTTYFIRSLTNMGYNEIGKLLGGRHHTTQINSMRQLRGWLEADTVLNEQIEEIRTTLKN